MILKSFDNSSSKSQTFSKKSLGREIVVFFLDRSLFFSNNQRRIYFETFFNLLLRFNNKEIFKLQNKFLFRSRIFKNIL